MRRRSFWRSASCSARRPQELSGGQKQRVAIGRAIVREPKLFLFDEPIAHLDAKLRAHMRGEIKHMQRTLGTTMIYVTHDQLEAMSMADMIAVMHEGELQQLGTPREIYNRPVNAWVAGFVGEPAMNFVDCNIEESGGKIRFTHPNFTISVTPEQAQALLAATYMRKRFEWAFDLMHWQSRSSSRRMSTSPARSSSTSFSAAI